MWKGLQLDAEARATFNHLLLPHSKIFICLSFVEVEFLSSLFLFKAFTMAARCRSRLLPGLRAAGFARLYSTESRLASDHVRIVEVGPRDGLQNEKKAIPKDIKLELIGKLAKTGVTTIEAGSFVPAKWVPQVYLYSTNGQLLK